jgi:hypothetical protein
MMEPCHLGDLPSRPPFSRNETYPNLDSRLKSTISEIMSTKDTGKGLIFLEKFALLPIA